MGYTHYFELRKGEYKLSKKCLVDIKKVITKYKKIIQYESDDNRDPIVTEELIRFNGIGKNGHETFFIRIPPIESDYSKFEKGFLFNFCKTARKPYDIVVCEVLLILKAELQDKMKLSSDGFSNSICAFDGAWSDAIENIKNMNYVIVCNVYSRELSIYYDCEIKSVLKEK